ncbi:hypothetical protein [Sagittula sp. S175]|uniref:hypothetical protein n=1 Tax=Sagittula sp. S175 TaxID=3415129 RepID=UPI003C7A117D
MTRFRAVALFLILCGVNLALMVPGGFVETRSFPGYSVVLLGAFNVFLTVLGLGSLLLGYRAFRGQNVGGWAVLAGLSYVAVYLADIGRVFPVADSPMSATLATLEWLGTALGLVTAALGAWLMLAHSKSQGRRTALPHGLLAAMAVAAVAIIAFATWSVA